MTIEDNQLDDLLRNVQSPTGLKERLSQIPDSDAKFDYVARSRKKRMWSYLGIATSAAAAAVLLLFVYPSEVAQRIHPEVEEEKKLEQLLAEVRQELNTIDLLRQIEELERTNRTQPAQNPMMNLEESVALAMSISWKSSLDHGGSVESVRSELEYVVNTFPGTRGARDANEMLQIRPF